MSVEEARILPKERVRTFLAGVVGDGQLIAPVRVGPEDVSFQPVGSPDEVELHYVNSLIPPKRYVLPVHECLFRFSRDDDGWKLDPVLDERKRLIFGIRSCDVAAINFLDDFYAKEFDDIYYQTRRRNTTLVSIGCAEPGEHCFCVCCEGGPFLESGFDLQFTDLGDEYLVDIGSDKGAEIVRGNEELFETASEADVQRQHEIHEEAKQKFDPTSFMAAAIRRVTGDRAPDGFWEHWGRRCISCTGCTHVCPTCSCFDVVDVRSHDSHGARTRCWDSCQLAGYTREASGHNPREGAANRIKRRFYHKLSYPYVEIDGRHGCVGCGRCVTTCPANVGMVNVVTRMRNAGEHAKHLSAPSG
jgi:sulfhydrogenase subunit beta (sulfur reductase)